MTQRNTWDCGPIACAKILDLYGLWPKDGKVGKLRTFIINAYRQLLEGDTADIYIAVPTIEIDDDDSDGKTTSTPPIQLSWSAVDNPFMRCVSKWLSLAPICLFCRQEVSQITFQGAVIPFGDSTNANSDSTKSSLDFDIGSLMKSDQDESTSRHGRIRAATIIKRKRQDDSAEKMIRMRAKYSSEAGASVGAIVRVGNDARDVQNPRSTIGVIFDISDAGGVLVCTEWGVVVHGNRRKDHWVSSDRYEVVARASEDDAAVITPDLAAIRQEIRSDKFVKADKSTVTLQECHRVSQKICWQ